MTVFVSYHPGAKGKFIAEICDLSKHTNLRKTNLQKAGGNARWLDKMIRYLQDNNISISDIHGKFPEEEYCKTYINTVLAGMETLQSDLTVDTHYTEKCSLEYILEQGHKVIRIVVADEKGVESLQNNFFYKNFIDDEKSPIENRSRLAKNNIISCGNESYSKHIVEDFDNELLDKPISQWDKKALSILFDVCGVFTKKIQVYNLIRHPNLLEVNVTDLRYLDVLANIIKFAGGEMNKETRDRIVEYNKAQSNITTFDEYIETFINKYAKNN